MFTGKRCPNHPGEILKNMYLNELHITISDFATKLGVSRKAISAIVNKRKSVTPDMAIRLSRALNTTPELWMNLQTKYDLWNAYRKQETWQKIQPLESVRATATPI